MRQKIKISVIIFLFFILLIPIRVAAAGAESVQDFQKLKMRSRSGMTVHGSLITGVRCSYCHSRGGGRGLSDHEEWGCLVCHSALNDAEATSRGLGKKNPRMRQNVFGRFQAKEKKLDILSAYRKQYTHPTLSIKGVHGALEELSGNNEAERHAECPDCHHRHEVSQWNKLGPIEVMKKSGMKEKLKKLRNREVGEPVKDYELCFNCHSDNNKLPVDQTNKRMDFDENNPSYHPVLSVGKNGNVPSLINEYTAESIITCSDCHNNDDKNGPQGPHGSNYMFILKNRYSIEDGLSESPGEYELCYTCHKRSSILGDQSFTLHRMHIEGNPVTGNKGTSCFTCHDAHGSEENTHLIRFNKEVVFQNPSTNEIKFVDKGELEGECSLMCHDTNHNPKVYLRP